MELKRWSVATLLIGIVGCGATNDRGAGIGTEDDADPATGVYQPGDPVDLDGDGDADDGFAVDSDGDGVADGVDTDGNGTKDANLPTTGPMSGGNSAGGTSAGSNATTGNANGNCKEYAVRNERVTPDMLIVLDRSGSMKASESGGIDRWGGSVSGLKEITSSLEKSIQFGLMTFPGKGPGMGSLAGGCVAGAIDVPIQASAAAKIAAALDMASPDGSTPTAISLAAAHQAIKSAPLNPDAVPHPKYVLLVTDGSPNCDCQPTDFACLIQSVQPGAVSKTIMEIQSLAKDGIKTYVFGFGTKQDTRLAASLDMMASAGGTGETAHRAIEDKASIVQAFKEIAGKAVSCTFVLEEAPPMADFVLVKVDGKQVNLNDPNGWQLSADGKQVQIQGTSCSSLQDGNDHLLTVDVKCDRVVVE